MITVMWKISIIMVVALMCLLYSIAAPSSKEYWENVGPHWDRMLNPCKYYQGIMPLEGECK
jgi:hypothetical protein